MGDALDALMAGMGGPSRARPPIGGPIRHPTARPTPHSPAALSTPQILAANAVRTAAPPRRAYGLGEASQLAAPPALHPKPGLGQAFGQGLLGAGGPSYAAGPSYGGAPSRQAPPPSSRLDAAARQAAPPPSSRLERDAVRRQHAPSSPRGPLAPHPSWAASPARGMPARAPAPEPPPHRSGARSPRHHEPPAAHPHRGGGGGSGRASRNSNDSGGQSTESSPTPTPRPALEHAYASDQNAAHRRYMEDDMAVVERFAGDADNLYVGVYDGHGGRGAVDFVVAHLHTALANEWKASRGADAHGCFGRAFAKIDKMLAQAGAYACGTTANVVVCSRAGAYRSRTLLAANVGDSRTLVLCAGDAPPVRLSVEHLPADAAEVERVHAAGGHVTNGRVGGTLAVTRALGDHNLKGSGGLSHEPHFCAHEVRPQDRFVLMASDGVFDVVGEAEAQQIALAHEREPLKEIAAKIVQASIAKGSRDNVSALLVRLNGHC